MNIAEIAALHAKRVSTEQLLAFIDQLARKNPPRGSADDIRLESYCAEYRNRA